MAFIGKKPPVGIVRPASSWKAPRVKAPTPPSGGAAPPPEIPLGTRCRRFGGALAILGVMSFSQGLPAVKAHELDADPYSAGVATILNDVAPRADADMNLRSARALVESNTSTSLVPRGRSSGVVATAGANAPQWLEDAWNWTEKVPITFLKDKFEFVTSWIKRYPFRSLGIGLGLGLTLGWLFGRRRKHIGSRSYRTLDQADLNVGEFFDTGNVIMIKIAGPKKDQIKTIQCDTIYRSVILTFADRKPRNLERTLRKLFSDPTQLELARDFTQKLINDHGILKRSADGLYTLDIAEYNPWVTTRAIYRLTRLFRRKKPQTPEQRPAQQRASPPKRRKPKEAAPPPRDQETVELTADVGTEGTFFRNAFKDKTPAALSPTVGDTGAEKGNGLAPTAAATPANMQPTVNGHGASQAQTYRPEGKKK